MRSGIVISGLLHAVLLYVMLTQPLKLTREYRDPVQPLVEFTYFDSVTAIEVEVQEPIEEDETAGAEVEEPEPDSLGEAEEETSLAEESAPEDAAEEVTAEESAADLEPETMAESEAEPRAASEIAGRTVEEIAEEPVAESELPETAEASAPLELPQLPAQPEALTEALPQESVPEESVPLDIGAAEDLPPLAAAVPESATAESAPVAPDLTASDLTEATPVQPAQPESRSPTTEALSQDLPAAAETPLLEAVPETIPEPLVAEEPAETLELAAPLLTQPERLPLRRPPEIEQQPEQPQPSAVAEATTPSGSPSRDLTAQYQPRWQGRVRGDQLLDNLALVRDEEAQARANPALWEVVRLLRQQVKECWQLGRPGLENPDYFVEMEVRLLRSGALNHAHILDVAKMIEDESYAAFARNARTALERCAPYDLPADRFALWGDLVVRFLARGQALAGR